MAADFVFLEGLESGFGISSADPYNTKVIIKQTSACGS
jgi:hypothetical protein